MVIKEGDLNRDENNISTPYFDCSFEVWRGTRGFTNQLVLRQSWGLTITEKERDGGRERERYRGRESLR